MIALAFIIPIEVRAVRDRLGRWRQVSDVRGYCTMTWLGRFNERAKDYHRWAEKVRRYAFAAGFLQFPLPGSQQPVCIDVDCWFAIAQHPEPENVRKGIVDALYYNRWLPLKLKMLREGVPPGRHFDKYVHGSHGPAQVGESPRVEVRLKV